MAACGMNEYVIVPEEMIERIAQRAAQIVVASIDATNESASEYLTILEAAELLRAKRHRVDDLLSRGVLTRVKDGSRTLITRDELDAYLRGEATGRRR